MIIQPSEEALNHAFIREIITGEQLKNEITQSKREKDAASIAKDYRNRGRKRGDKLIHLAEIPQKEFLQMRMKYGEEEMNSLQFWRDFQRHEPTMASNKI